MPDKDKLEARDVRIHRCGSFTEGHIESMTEYRECVLRNVSLVNSLPHQIFNESFRSLFLKCSEKRT